MLLFKILPDPLNSILKCRITDNLNKTKWLLFADDMIN